MTLPTDYIDGDVLTAADVNAITLAVNSNTNSKIGVGTFNAKGDLLVGLTNDSVGVLSVGTNGFLLTADSSTASGLKWASPAGKVLQMQYVTSTTNASTTSTTYVDVTSMSISFTPISATSNIVIQFWGGLEVFLSGTTESERWQNTRLLRDATAITAATIGRELVAASAAASTLGDSYVPGSLTWTEASSSTTARTYKIQHEVPTTNITSLYKNRALVIWEVAS